MEIKPNAYLVSSSNWEVVVLKTDDNFTPIDAAIAGTQIHNELAIDSGASFSIGLDVEVREMHIFDKKPEIVCSAEVLASLGFHNKATQIRNDKKGKSK